MAQHIGTALHRYEPARKFYRRKKAKLGLQRKQWAFLAYENLRYITRRCGQVFEQQQECSAPPRLTLY